MSVESYLTTGACIPEVRRTPDAERIKIDRKTVLGCVSAIDIPWGNDPIRGR